MSRADRDDRDRRPRRPVKSGPSPLTIILIIGGIGLVFGLLVCCGVGGFVAYKYRTGGYGADLSEKNLQRVQPGMKRADIEKVLGRGRIATASDVSTAGLGNMVQFRAGCTKLMWRSGNTWFFVDVKDRTDQVVGMTRYSRGGS